MAVVQTYEDSDTVRRIARLGFSDTASTVKWSSEPLGRDAYRAEIAVVGDTLFAGVEDQLLALDAATGATRWKTTMRDKVTVGCAGCFAAVQGRLVVRTTDAYVTGYGTASNEILWSRRLNSPGGSISVARRPAVRRGRRRGRRRGHARRPGRCGQRQDDPHHVADVPLERGRPVGVGDVAG